MSKWQDRYFRLYCLSLAARSGAGKNMRGHNSLDHRRLFVDRRFASLRSVGACRHGAPTNVHHSDFSEHSLQLSGVTRAGYWTRNLVLTACASVALCNLGGPEDRDAHFHQKTVIGRVPQLAGRHPSVFFDRCK
jgi:hypothetical protein